MNEVLKRCCKCKKEKEIHLFYGDCTKKDKHSVMCIECNKVSSKKNIDYRRDFCNDIKGRMTCCVCGESDSSCLDFHHIDEKLESLKKRGVIRQLGIKRIIEEINKCICLCANCHRKLHTRSISLLEECIEKSRIRI